MIRAKTLEQNRMAPWLLTAVLVVIMAVPLFANDAAAATEEQAQTSHEQTQTSQQAGSAAKVQSQAGQQNEPQAGQQVQAQPDRQAEGQTGQQAQSQAGRQTQAQANQQTEGRKIRDEQILRGYRGLVGREIRNNANEAIGEIEDIVAGIDAEKVQAVVSVGGFWGIGDEEIVIPLEKFRLTKRRPYVFFDGTEEELESYPAYREPFYRGARARYPYYRYYPPRYGYGYRQMERGPGSEGTYYRDYGERDYRAYYGQARMPAYDEGRPPMFGAARRTDRQNGSLQASEIIGKPVQNANDQKIGQVEDIIIGRDGRINLLISVGGFLGVGEKRIQADLQEVDLDNQDYVFYDITKQELEQEPAYKAARRQ